ncbi:hypothetical protein FB45DRAFT_887432, partial [Roridomyces roridus]
MFHFHLRAAYSIPRVSLSCIQPNSFGRAASFRGMRTRRTRPTIRRPHQAHLAARREPFECQTTEPAVAFPSRPDYSHIYKNWFTTSNPPWKWSTDWEVWDGLDLFTSPDMLDVAEHHFTQPWNTCIEGILAEDFGITDPVEPILFLPGDGGEWFVFAAGGKYYSYDDGFVSRYMWEYKDKDDFAARFMEEERTAGSKQLQFMDKKSGTRTGTITTRDEYM